MIKFPSLYFALVAGFAVSLSCLPAQADTIYTYQGKNYTSLGGTYLTGGPYALSVTFNTTLAENALLNLPFTNITSTVTSYSFSDRSGLTLDNVNNALGVLKINVSTNTSGNVVAWFVGAYTPGAQTQMQTNFNSPYGFIPGADFSETTPNFAGSYGFTSQQGTWNRVPEPTTLVLLGTGVVSLLAYAWRRGK